MISPAPTTKGILLPWREVAARWNRHSGESISYQACQHIADKAVRKLRIELKTTGLGREMFTTAADDVGVGW